MSDPHHQQQQQIGQHRNLPQTVPGPPPYSTLGRTHKQQRSLEDISYNRSRSRSPATRSERATTGSPPTKKSHTVSGSESDNDRTMDFTNHQDFPELTAARKPPSYSFLLTNFDTKYQNTKILLQQFIKYVNRDTIIRLIPTRNGIIVQSTDSNLANKIRDKHSFEIFGKTASMTRLENKPTRLPPPPRKSPTLSVVIRGAEPFLTDEEVESELKLEGHNIIKCIRIKNKQGGPTYMIRVLTDRQDTIDDLLSNGAYIYKKRYRVEPSHTPAPLPVRCEKCQTYNHHHTANCSNETKCGFCTGPHSTKSCPNLQKPPKCTTCGDAHPTFSYKCKARPPAEPDKPELIVPIRPPDTQNPTNAPVTSVFQSITIDQLLAFLTITLQNIHPFQRKHILQQIQYAAKTILHVNFTATYSGPYAHFHAYALETEV